MRRKGFSRVVAFALAGFLLFSDNSFLTLAAGLSDVAQESFSEEELMTEEATSEEASQPEENPEIFSGGGGRSRRKI